MQLLLFRFACEKSNLFLCVGATLSRQQTKTIALANANVRVQPLIIQLR